MLGFRGKCELDTIYASFDTVILHSILFLEQVEIMATSVLTSFCSRLDCSDYNLVMRFTLIILNSNDLRDEPSTKVIEMLWSYLQVGMMQLQTAWKVTQCTWTYNGKKPLKSANSWHYVIRYALFQHWKINDLHTTITWPSEIFCRTFTLIHEMPTFQNHWFKNLESACNLG